MLSRTLQHDHGMMTVLGLMTGQERLVWFLIDLSNRLSERGFATSEFVLRMSRTDIASCLGLRLETISRELSRLSGAGLLEIKGRHVRLIDMPALMAIYETVQLNGLPETA